MSPEPCRGFQECDFPSRELAHNISVRRRAKGSLDGALLVSFKSRHGVESTAAYNSDGRFHSCMSSNNTPPVEAG